MVTVQWQDAVGDPDSEQCFYCATNLSPHSLDRSGDQDTMQVISLSPDMIGEARWKAAFCWQHPPFPNFPTLAAPSPPPMCCR